jgi:glucokinase
MYLGIDVGGTKTLFAVFDKNGEMVCEKKISTNQDYQQFKGDLSRELEQLTEQFQFSNCCCALPGVIDFAKGAVIAFGNEKWRDIPVRNDLQAVLPGVKVLIQNDAKLAGLGEEILLH